MLARVVDASGNKQMKSDFENVPLHRTFSKAVEKLNEGSSSLFETIQEQNIVTDKDSLSFFDQIKGYDVDKFISCFENIVKDTEDNTTDRQMAILVLKILGIASDDVRSIGSFSKEWLDRVYESKKIDNDVNDSGEAKKTRAAPKRGGGSERKKTNAFILRDGCTFKPIVLNKWSNISDVRYQFDKATHRDNLDSTCFVWKVKKYVPLPDDDGNVSSLKIHDECIEFYKAWVVVDLKKNKPRLLVKPLRAVDIRASNAHYSVELKKVIFELFNNAKFVKWVASKAKKNKSEDEDVFDDDEDDNHASSADDVDVQKRGTSSKKSDASEDGENDDDDSNDEATLGRLKKLWRYLCKAEVYKKISAFKLENTDQSTVLSEYDEDDAPVTIFFEKLSQLLPHRINEEKSIVSKKSSSQNDKQSDEQRRSFFGWGYNEEGGRVKTKNGVAYSDDDNVIIASGPAINEAKFRDNGWNLFLQPNCMHFINKESFEKYVERLKQLSVDVDQFDAFVSDLPTSRSKRGSAATSGRNASGKKNDSKSKHKSEKKSPKRKQDDDEDSESDEDDVISVALTKHVKKRKQQQQQQQQSKVDKRDKSQKKKRGSKQKRDPPSSSSSESDEVEKKQPAKKNNKRKRNSERDDDDEEDQGRIVKRSKKSSPKKKDTFDDDDDRSKKKRSKKQRDDEDSSSDDVSNESRDVKKPSAKNGSDNNGGSEEDEDDDMF